MDHYNEVVTVDIAVGEYERYCREIARSIDNESAPMHSWICRTYPHLAKHKEIWSKSQSVDSDEVLYSQTDLAHSYYDLGLEDGGKPCQHNIIDRYAEEIANKIQFPKDTAYAFALGAVASAMTKSFSYKLNAKDDYSRSPVNLYVVAGQPPGSAKSGVFKNLVMPIQMAYKDYNAKQHIKRQQIKLKIDEFKKQIKNAANDTEKAALIRDLSELENELLETPVYVYAVDDATPEGLRDLAAAQKGMINMVSEESDLVNVLLGNVYGDGRRKSNNSMFLKAWDGEMISVARADQDAITLNVKASLAVLAQDEAIKSILEAGMSGRGINERVLIIREKDMLDKIDFRARRTETVDTRIRKEYSEMINAMVFSDDTIFVLSDEANEALIMYMEDMQVRSRFNPVYRDPTIQGVISKGEKQICKLASIIHAADSYEKTASFSREITETAMRRAIGIFKDLTEQYIKAAESQGYAGDEPRAQRVISYLEGRAERKIMRVSISLIRDAVKSHDSFKRVDSVSSKLKNDILPLLEKKGKIAVAGDKVYLNPREFG